MNFSRLTTLKLKNPKKLCKTHWAGFLLKKLPDFINRDEVGGSYLHIELTFLFEP